MSQRQRVEAIVKEHFFNCSAESPLFDLLKKEFETMLFCNTCGDEMKIDTNGIACVMIDSEKQPYKIFMGDRYVCTCCGQSTITTNHNPAYESFQDDFKENLKRFDAKGLLVPTLNALVGDGYVL